MHAADTGLYLRGASLAQLNETITKDLESLDHWLKGNKLSLNVVKTFSLLHEKQHHVLVILLCKLIPKHLNESVYIK